MSHCKGTITLRTVANNRQRALTVVRVSFKLAPGQLATISFPVPKAVQKLLHRVHRLKLHATGPRTMALGTPATPIVSSCSGSGAGSAVVG